MSAATAAAAAAHITHCCPVRVSVCVCVRASECVPQSKYASPHCTQAAAIDVDVSRQCRGESFCFFSV